MLRAFFLTTALTSLASAHTAAWAKGMYCRGGPDPNQDDQNTNTAVNPLYNLTKEDWWFQHDRGCDAVPPPAGEFLELPANGDFTVELAHNRAFTTLSYDGKFVTDWPDGQNHTDDMNAWKGEGSSCLEDGALHTYNESNAAGTAWGISYESELSKVTMENLVVFSVLKHTPWKRLATYQVPDLPACPEEGCTCAWLWVPDGCGQGNMYMQPYKCNVTNAKSSTPLAKARAAVLCADDSSKCVQGAKQMIAWHQLTGNNIETEWPVSPGYSEKLGWKDGAQTDIFESNSTVTSVRPSLASSTLVTRVATSVGTQTPVKQEAASTAAPCSATIHGRQDVANA